MQVSVHQTSELKRKMKVQVPEDTIQSECAKRIDSLARKMKLDGFRPGKVPLGIIRKRYGKSVRNEVVGELIRSSLFDALHDHDLRPAGAPHIENTVDEAGKGLEYEASFEIYPDIRINSYRDLNVVRPVCELTESDIDKMVEKLRRQRRKWRPVDRESAHNDRLTISFSGAVEGENFTGGTVDDFQVEIGAQEMIPGFEDNLIGLGEGRDKMFTLRFPEDYKNAKFAGKAGEFEVHVKKIEEPELPEVDEEFIRQYGIESGELGEFRRSLKDSMEREKNRAIRAKTKNAVMDALLEANSVALPEVLVDQEIEQLRKQHATQHGGSEPAPSGEEFEYYEPQARRRVKLGLLLAEIVAQNDLKPDSGRVRKAVEGLAQNFNSPDAVVDWYYANPEQLRTIEQMVLEDQVVDLILQGAAVTDEPIEFSSLTVSD